MEVLKGDIKAGVALAYNLHRLILYIVVRLSGRLASSLESAYCVCVVKLQCH